MVHTHTLATSGPGGGKRGTVPPAKRGPKYRQPCKYFSFAYLRGEPQRNSPPMLKPLLPGALAGAMAAAASRAAEEEGAAEEGGGVRGGAGSGAAGDGAGGAARPCPPCRDCASCLASASAPVSTPPSARAREAGVAREAVREAAKEDAGVARPPGAAAPARRENVKRRQVESA